MFCIIPNTSKPGRPSAMLSQSHLGGEAPLREIARVVADHVE
ncbi:MAG TPA: hypothetical protein VNQ78_03565 [Paracoccus sp. (in: a-proteobacteria)]|nr:hypothetical protein [Paracoccus sp. (in: a-proteobacteria)]